MEFCSSCGRAVSPEAPYCASCGASLRSTESYYSSRQPYSMGTFAVPRKSTVIAAALGLVPGFFGFWGLGQMYAGKIGKGIALLIAGLIIGGLFWFSVILTVILIGYVGIAIFGIIFVGGWLWQTVDAYGTAQEYNELHTQPARTQW
ncbi:MAG: zinc-ribbon domain-containing protein [Thaumarchaeota archaeon]|nr:zinc-ribbon domain-containing protein [Nitrososphaerota archaeon]